MYLTYQELLSKWLLDKQKEIKSSSCMNYESAIRNTIIPYLGHMKINNINYEVIHRYYKEQVSSFSLNYQKLIFCIIKNSLKRYESPYWAVKKFMRENILRTQLTHSMNSFSEKELNQIIEICTSESNKYHFSILVAIYTGMRIGEICALKFSDFDMNKNVIRVYKTLYRIKDDTMTKLKISTTKTRYSERIIPMNKSLKKELMKIPYHEDNYIASHSSTPIDPRVLRRYFKHLLIKHHLKPIRFHDLRHSFANLCVKKGIDYKSISELLGHANISTTLNIYVHSNISLKHRAINKLF